MTLTQFLLFANLLIALLRREAAAAVPYRIGLHLAALEHEGFWLAAPARRDGLHGAAGRYGGVILLQDRSTVHLNGEFVPVLNQEPVCALAAFPVVGHSNQDEAAMQPIAFEGELKIALCQRCSGLLFPSGSQ